MRYQVGEAGRVVVARFEDKENFLKGIKDIARNEKIKSSVFYLLGGIRGGKIVVGPEKDEIPPTPIWKELKESHELLGIGTIFWEGEEPKVHFHGAFGKREMVSIGCLREVAETFLVLEAVIIEIEGITAERKYDPVSGFSLLKL
ncbi:MAG: DUF296 domain-containing protein [Nitrospira sp.]|nr:DUF296 domain-containing protein [Nitrospira sp.]